MEYCCPEFEYAHEKEGIGTELTAWVLYMGKKEERNWLYIFYCPFCGSKLSPLTKD